MSNLYGVARISTRKQNIERQVRNIQAKYPNATIIQETYTGTKLNGRREFEKLLKILKAGDKLVFDSVSRMSRNSQEGCELYEDLFNKDIAIEFLKEPHINTEVYKKALQGQIQIEIDTGNKATNELMNNIINSLNKYTIALAKEQIKIAFDQAEKEVQDLHQRTRERNVDRKIEWKANRSAKRCKANHKEEYKSKRGNNKT